MQLHVSYATKKKVAYDTCSCIKQVTKDDSFITSEYIFLHFQDQLILLDLIRWSSFVASTNYYDMHSTICINY
jgi:hypothetical protein